MKNIDFGTNMRRIKMRLLVIVDKKGKILSETYFLIITKMKKYVAEAFGTFVLVLVGCGSAVIAGDQIGYLGISLAFGLAVLTMAYAIGPISGCHVNPAVSFGMWLRKQMTTTEMIGYMASQFSAAVLAAVVLMIIVGGNENLGANGF
jgi:aquaporin Z